MEVDDIVNDDELKSDKENDLYPIASDPYVESIEPKHLHEGIKHTFLRFFIRISNHMTSVYDIIRMKKKERIIHHFYYLEKYSTESDIESYNGSEVAKPPSPVIDENARAGAHDIDNIHQVITLSPNQILPATDENAVDSMDFENQLR